MSLYKKTHQISKKTTNNVKILREYFQKNGLCHVNFANFSISAFFADYEFV